MFSASKYERPEPLPVPAFRVNCHAPGARGGQAALMEPMSTFTPGPMVELIAMRLT
jgi:hypothetical protein